jgi:hypothetical protein
MSALIEVIELLDGHLIRVWASGQIIGYCGYTIKPPRRDTWTDVLGDQDYKLGDPITSLRLSTINQALELIFRQRYP